MQKRSNTTQGQARIRLQGRGPLGEEGVLGWEGDPGGGQAVPLLPAGGDRHGAPPVPGGHQGVGRRVVRPPGEGRGDTKFLQQPTPLAAHSVAAWSSRQAWGR